MSIPWTTDAVLRRAVEAGSDRIAVVFAEDDSSLTYGQLEQQANRLANLLRARGVRQGDRIAVLMENRPEYIVAYHGVARSGGIFVPIVTQSKLPEIEYFIGHSEPCVLIIDEDRWEVLAAAIAGGNPALASIRDILFVGRDAPAGTTRFDEALQAAAETPPEWRPTPDDPVAFMYTSGSTGRPKAVIHSHYTAVAQAEGVSSRMGYTAEDRLMTVFPLFHGNALVWSALAAVWSGARVIIHRRFSASGFWDSARKHGATEVNLLLGAINMVLAQPESADDRNHPVRVILANVTETIYRSFTERFGVDITSTWALAEGPLGTLTAPGHGYRAGEIGWPMGQDNEIRVVDEDDIEMPPGVVGELVQRNRAMMLGYYKNEAETARVLRGGWIHSGDLGYRDENGLFYFVGRQKHVIRRSGENISAEEVEECLQSQPAIEEAAVIPVPDDTRGEEVKAFVVVRPGAMVTPEEIIVWCDGRLSDFKIPRYIEFIASLPRTGPVKLNRPALQQRGEQINCWDRKAQAMQKPAIQKTGA